MCALDNAMLHHLLTRVQRALAARGATAYLVGGWLRDQLLRRPPAYLNIDLAVPDGALEHAQAIATALGGAFVPLDEAFGSARVVVETAAGRVEFDVSDFRGPDLASDLSRRDFTVNALAIPLERWLASPEDLAGVIDPLNGRDAIRAMRLIPCFRGAFEEDPARILRAYRFESQLGFALAPEALPLMRAAVPGLARVSGERVRDELLAILHTDAAGPAIRSLHALGALTALIPELEPGRDLVQGELHHLDVLNHQLEAVAQADRILVDCGEFSSPLREALARYIAEPVTDRRTRKALIKLGALIHDIGKPATRTVHDDGDIWFLGHEHVGAELAEAVVARLRLSNREGRLVCQLVRHHLRPGFLSREPHLTRRAVYRYYRDLEQEGPACGLAWWADRLATRGPLSRVDQIDEQRAFLEELLAAYFFQAAEVITPPRVITGRELMAALGLTPGPVVGALLDAIEEAQAEGTITTREEALALAQARLRAR